MNEQKKTYFETSGNGFGFGNGNGFGYGNGFGEGNGYGNGFGEGNGYGEGCGDGYGDGYGNGYGNGSSKGNGYGDGNGNGYGYGYGYGNGYGYGYGNTILLSPIWAYHMISHRRKHARKDITPEYAYNAGEKIRLCEYGLHASLDLINALGYKEMGSTATKVQCSGRVIFGSDKLVCEHREVVEVL
jgi:hypothetical protein